MRVRRISALLICLLFLLPLSCAAEEVKSGFSERLSDLRFSDMADLPADHWSKPAVYTCAALGILKGSSGNFYPAGTATRSETLAVLMRAAGLEQSAKLAWQNIQSLKQKAPYSYNRVDEWADGYIRLAVDYGILNIDQYNAAMGVPYGENATFQKDKPVTRLEAAEWFVRIFELPLAERADLVTDYADSYAVPQESLLYIETALRAELIRGYGNSLGLDNTISRQELAQILFNARHLVCEKMGVSVQTASILDTVTDTVSASEQSMTNQTTLLLSDETRITTVRTYALSGAAVDYSVLNPEDTDIVTIVPGREPSGVHLLNRGDKADFFRDKDGVLFLILSGLEEKSETPVENLDEGYEEGPPVSGKLYVADEKNRLLILEKNGEYIEVPYLSGIQVFRRNTEIPFDALITEHLDKNCMIFRVKKEGGTSYRAYRIQILE